MGAWGVKIFQNDDACDLRDDYKEKLLVGLTDAAAPSSYAPMNAFLDGLLVRTLSEPDQ